MIAKEHIDDLLNRNGNILTTDGDKIGSLGQVYADDETGQPSWVTAKTGLFGTSESFVPLEGAQVRGDDIVVPYAKDLIKDAPRVDVDGHLEPSEEDRLYQHYRLGGGVRTYTEAANDRDGGVADVDSRRAEGLNEGRATAGTVDRDTSEPARDDAMTRSEERLNVGTEKQEAGRARLRKYVTTENVTQTVPVRREEVRLEREPITDANRDQAMSGQDLSEDEHEVILHEERPVVDKETVPVERVRLGTETVTDEVTVDEEVRKERIDTDGTGDARR